MSGPSKARSTVSWGLLDQAVASGATFLFVVVAAVSLSAAEVGAIAVAFEFYTLSAYISRGVAGDPLTSRFSGASADILTQRTRAAAAASLLSGMVIGLILAIIAVFVPPPLRVVLLIAAIAMPLLALQDFVRAALIVQGRVRSTFINDTVWAVGQLPAMGIAIAIHPTAATVFAAWAITGCFAALLGLVQLRCRPGGVRSARAWLVENRDLWPYYLADNMLFGLTTLLFVLVLSGTAGLAAMAAFRVAMTVYAPLSLVGRGIISVSVAMLAKLRDNPQAVRRRALTISVALTPLAIGWGLLTLLVPTSVGEALFGESWDRAEPVVFLASFVCAAGLFSTGVTIGLRSLSAGRESLIGRIFASVGAATAASIGGILGAEHGLFVALALFFPVQATVWWLLLRHAARRPPSATSVTLLAQ